jgi:hypothetical protein
MLNNERRTIFGIPAQRLSSSAAGQGAAEDDLP